MQNFKAHVLSGLALVLFSILAVSSTVNKIHLGAFNYSNAVESSADTGTYLLTNDGTKIYGSRIEYTFGLLAKKQIKIDDQKFKSAEIKGYHTNGAYFGRLGNEYIRRIVHGKINVYVKFTQVSSTSSDHFGNTYNHDYTRTDHYAQKGEDGELLEIAGQSDIKRLLSDCPAAVAMADISNAQMRKEIRKNPNYLNRIFDLYNNDCVPGKK